MKLNARSFIAGVIITLLMTVFIQPVIASIAQKQITVYPGVNVYLDDIKLDPKDANGNPVEVFIYNGTTYLPVRAISEALNVAVYWDGKKSSVYLGKHDTNEPSVMLYDLDYFTKYAGFEKENWVKDNVGNSYDNVLTFTTKNDESSQEYLINGKYRRLKGRFILSYDTRSTDEVGQIRVYGDDKLIYSSPELTGGGMPIDFDIDIEGVIRMKIEFVRIKNYTGTFSA